MRHDAELPCMEQPTLSRKTSTSTISTEGGGDGTGSKSTKERRRSFVVHSRMRRVGSHSRLNRLGKMTPLISKAQETSRPVSSVQLSEMNKTSGRPTLHRVHTSSGTVEHRSRRADSISTTGTAASASTANQPSTTQGKKTVTKANSDAGALSTATAPITTKTEAEPAAASTATAPPVEGTQGLSTGETGTTTGATKGASVAVSSSRKLPTSTPVTTTAAGILHHGTPGKTNVAGNRTGVDDAASVANTDMATKTSLSSRYHPSPTDSNLSEMMIRHRLGHRITKTADQLFDLGTPTSRTQQKILIQRAQSQFEALEDEGGPDTVDRKFLYPRSRQVRDAIQHQRRDVFRFQNTILEGLSRLDLSRVHTPAEGGAHGSDMDALVKDLSVRLNKLQLLK
ncbi:TORC1 subunit Tco89 [Schizosaccharomyces japonicus yFS275]|uniref:TORC1 subunit Tco89 n=1 Tax=Schizosaccharomyces japonicus (strain yFS275 / FY16936) TaxID=402676 RepID=B6JYN7_SCHJY|nr:TORC1 subunit Tco89 [Schizosaccharomyces japonicus yFS275]EEB06655.2 TORC1 subunit Tco89 [Schizosaccharomyces japonicus yFS275]